MAVSTDLMSRINQNYSAMSKGHKAIANYITDHYEKAAFLSAAKLGEAAGVSETTVMRFTSVLGYESYPKFHRDLEDMMMKMVSSRHGEEMPAHNKSDSGLLGSVLTSDAKKIFMTLDEIDRTAFDHAVTTILQAKRIFVIGIRSCAPLASFFAFYLQMIFDGVHLLVTTSTSELFEQMIDINEDDVIIGISFPRYSMRTLKAMEFANSRRAKVITITDSVHSPMNLYSSCNLIAKSDMTTIVDSLVAPLSVINALIVILCQNKRDEVVKRMDALDQIWEDYQFYSNDELSQVGDSIRIKYKDPEDAL